MSLGFVAAAATGILTKQKGGRENTIVHGFSMILAFLLSLAGWYVIYEQKIMLGKPHNTSWHAWIGLLAIGGYALGAIGGLAGLHPDFGVVRRVQSFRLAHKLSARAATAAAFTAIGTGWYKLGGPASTSMVAISLIAVAGLLRLAGGKAGMPPIAGLSNSKV